MWYRAYIGQHHRVRIESHSSSGKKVYWTARIVFVSGSYPWGRLVAERIVENSESQLWKRICSAIRKDR